MTLALRRLVQLVLVLFGLSLLVFAWTRALPGGPEHGLLGERGTPQRAAEIRRLYGLDRPLHAQYGSYLTQIVRLDFGQSIATRQDVTDEIRSRFPATLELACAAMVIAVGLGIPLGLLAARHPRSWVDHASMAGSVVAISVPVFVLAFLLKYIFALRLGWLPSVGRADVTSMANHPSGLYVIDAVITADGRALGDALRHLALPAVALSAVPLALIARITRASALEAANEDYVRTAIAKGLGQRAVARGHILRNAMSPVITVAGLQTGLLLSGAVLTEVVFAWGGMGSLLYRAVFDRDYPVLHAGILSLAVVFVVVNLVVDVLHGAVDPRTRGG